MPTIDELDHLNGSIETVCWRLQGNGGGPKHADYRQALQWASILKDRADDVGCYARAALLLDECVSKGKSHDKVMAEVLGQMLDTVWAEDLREVAA